MNFMSRSALEFHTGRPAPADTHHVEGDRAGRWKRITYAEWMAAKRDRQRKDLERLLRVELWRPWLLSVRWCPGLGDAGFFRGYYAGLYRPPDEFMWLRDSMFPFNARQLFPVGLLPNVSNYDWMEAFAIAYQVGTRNGHPYGSRVVWRRGYELQKESPNAQAE